MPTAAQMPPGPTAADYDEFRRQRQEYATGRRSPVHFYWGNHVEKPRSRILGSPGRWSPLGDGRAGLAVYAVREDGIRIGGELVDGRAELWWRDADGPTTAQLPGGAEAQIFSYDGRRFALQVWNDHSAWAERFAGISAYPHDPAWRLVARQEAVESGQTVAISHYRHPEPVQVPVSAAVSFEHDGHAIRLLATGGPSNMVVQFRDATNGHESYGAGRTVRVWPSDDGRTALIDFNYATLLPCAFSEAWNCPLPPAENRLPFAVRAGERNAVDHDGQPML